MGGPPPVRGAARSMTTTGVAGRGPGSLLPRRLMPPPIRRCRVSPQALAFALLLVSTGNLLVSVVPGGGVGGDWTDAMMTSRTTNDDEGPPPVDGGDGLGELGELGVSGGGGEDASDERSARGGVSCHALATVEEVDECLRERERRAAEREARRRKSGGGALTKAEREAALEAYKKRVRREKALKFKQRDDERDQLAGYQELEARSKEAARAAARAAGASGGYTDDGSAGGFAGGAAGETLSSNGAWSGVASNDTAVRGGGGGATGAGFTPRPRTPPAPPGAGGAYPVEGSESATAARALRPCVPRYTEGDDDDAEWLEPLDGEPLTVRKREFGRLSKKKQTMKTLKYHHAPALALLPSGQVFAAWQAAESLEGEAGQRVQMSVSDDEGKNWALSWELPVTRNAAQWSPIPHVDNAGVLHLFYAESDGGCIRPGRPKPRYAPGGTVLVTTVDLSGGGECGGGEGGEGNPCRLTDSSVWSEPRVVLSVDDGGDFIPKLLSNPLLAHSSGAWILPFWRDNTPLVGVKWPEGGAHAHCHVTTSSASLTAVRKAEISAGVLVSHDGGATWTARGALRDALAPGAADSWAVGTRTTPLVEHSAVELPGGGVALYCRTTTGFLYITTSQDMGRTWTEPVPVEALKDPGGKPQAVRWRPGGGAGAGAGAGGGEGVIMVAWNDHTRDGVESRSTGKTEKVPEKCRTALSLALSHDRGDTWQRAGVVAGVVGPGLAPGLRFHHPWMLRVGCKVLVAYSKFYVSWYGMGKKEETHFSVRVVHVELALAATPFVKVCAANLLTYTCRRPTGVVPAEVEEDEEAAGGAGGIGGEDREGGEGTETSETEAESESEASRRQKQRERKHDPLGSLQLPSNIRRELDVALVQRDRAPVEEAAAAEEETEGEGEGDEKGAGDPERRPESVRR